MTETKCSLGISYARQIAANKKNLKRYREFKAARDARQHMIEADMDMSYSGEMDVDHAECD